MLVRSAQKGPQHLRRVPWVATALLMDFLLLAVCAQQVIFAQADLPRPLPQAALGAMSARPVTTARMVALQLRLALQAHFRALLETWLSRTVWIARRVATVKVLGCPHRQHSVMLATTALVARLLQHHQATYAILGTTVLRAAQYRHFVRRDSINHLQAARPAWRVQKDDT